MQSKGRRGWFHILFVPGVVASCAAPSTSPSSPLKRAEFATQFCALAKPCASGAATTAACESAVAASLPATFSEAAGQVSIKALRAAQSSPPSCGEPASLAALATAVPLDLPKGASSTEAPLVFSIVLAADGTTQIDGAPVPNDEAILAAARAARAKNPELRAVIKADSAMSHGRVIHVLDLLKQAQVGKIAFGVSPTPPSAPP